MNRRESLKVTAPAFASLAVGITLTSCWESGPEGKPPYGFLDLFKDGADFVGFDGKPLRITALEVAEYMEEWTKKYGDKATQASIVAIGVGSCLKVLPFPAARIAGVTLNKAGIISLKLLKLDWEEISESIEIQDEEARDEILSKRKITLYRGDGETFPRAVDTFDY